MLDKILKDLNRFVDQAGSQQKAAEHLGVTHQFVSYLLKKERPMPERIAAKLGWKKVWQRKRKGEQA